MIPYGLTKNMSCKVHSHNKCTCCNSEVGKRHGRSKARQLQKRELKYILEKLK